jgi:DNA integrity scanning protein DisA with diadenylate cyclase activity
MLKNSETIKKDLIEIGKEGSILNLRYKELMKGIEKKEEEILRDYSKIALRKTKKLLDNLSFEGLLDLDTIARLVFEKTLDENVSPRGFRFLSNSNLNEKEVSLVVEQFSTLNEILNDDTNRIESVLKNNSKAIRENMIALKEQIIEGKRVI